jgi:hypothetical protein
MVSAVDVVKFCIEAQTGKTALIWAVDKSNQATSVRLLLDSGADVDATDNVRGVGVLIIVDSTCLC